MLTSSIIRKKDFMTILGITNRTENWKTARHMSPLFGANAVRLAWRLLPQGEGHSTLREGDVRLELFWKGIRDYEDKHKKIEDKALADAYSRLFPDLLKDVQAFTGPKQFRQPITDKNNYDVSMAKGIDKLGKNLRNTEIDIVLQSPGRLFIGEAKGESSLGGNSDYVLVHQLIRQYVAAHVLLKILKMEQVVEVIPFVVGNDRADLLKHSQVRFMTEQKKWMRKENVLEWDDIEALR